MMSFDVSVFAERFSEVLPEGVLQDVILKPNTSVPNTILGLVNTDQPPVLSAK
jgi:hypothetical protein